MVLPTALPTGTIIGGHYIVGNLINRGGFGAVYRATDTSEGHRLCALKEIYNVTPAARRQALLEASVLLTIRNHHLPQVYDALEANGRFYLVMELIEGHNLLDTLRSRVPGGIVGEQEPFRQQRGPCSEREVLDWLLPIIDVLQELHSRSNPILHRDIKPGNIILRPDQSAVLVDFGLTRLYDPQRETGTLARAVTEGFSPPEQYMGRTTPQSDIYALAATMYLMLTNRMPQMAMQRSVHDTLIPPRQLNPALSPSVERALLKALSVQAGLRFQSMREFGEALRNPGFNGYSDQTIAASVPITATQPSIQPPPRQQGPLRLPAPVLPPVQAPTRPASPHPQPVQPQQRSYNAGYSPASYTPPAFAGYSGAQEYPYHPNAPQPGYNARQQPMPAPPPVLRQPSASGQGCLWGLVQGLLSGLLVAFTSEPSNFYLGLVMGFGFYLLAGFMTSRKGGGFLSGIWAGFWTGILSVVWFWITYGVCYVILLFQKMGQLQHDGVRADKVFERAREAIHTALPSSQSGGDAQTNLTNLLIIAGIGLVVAMVMGLIGGLLGNSFFKSWWRGQQQRTIASQQPQHQQLRP
jgi:serine/threonine protein kinase